MPPRTRKNWSFENVIKKISIGVTDANKIPLDLSKREHTGILRTAREGWRHGSDWDDFYLTTDYGKTGNSKYNIYESRLDETIKKPLKNPYSDISLTIPRIKNGEKELLHGDDLFINNAFSHIEKLYNFLQKKYINKEINDKDLKVINNIIAQIRWIMAHATPWERGSDAISNVFMKSLYKSLGIKTYEPAKGISFDMEAFCTNLKDYKKNFQNYFSLPTTVAK